MSIQMIFVKIRNCRSYEFSEICQENRGTTPDECAYNEVSNHSEKMLTKWEADIN